MDATSNRVSGSTGGPGAAGNCAALSAASVAPVAIGTTSDTTAAAASTTFTLTFCWCRRSESGARLTSGGSAAARVVRGPIQGPAASKNKENSAAQRLSMVLYLLCEAQPEDRKEMMPPESRQFLSLDRQTISQLTS